MIRVLLVEDEVMWQQGVTALLAVEPEIKLIGVVDNANDAEVFFDAEKPDILLIDWKIRGARDGLELAKAMEAKLPAHRMILVTGSPPDQVPPHPYGYVPKPKIVSDLVQGIRNAMLQPA
jgi:YesN/AraC family two-component response regulator